MKSNFVHNITLLNSVELCLIALSFPVSATFILESFVGPMITTHQLSNVMWTPYMIT